ncbi:hypothetical protein EPA93_23240 [Ktedonosporobacter rubrisoli]|uniref:Uncharacterized protein n=1 Tax=Ktedonosporobacter rubrisoli TaxID=2509675 RepID=A0A4P6JT43_KTERU|nr:hypothetical protein [Ktedonosporobacter rubrisoli]QBD78739.1 hypothetical protein EPA93_23240 [Ktedonosporobacter rubrisoli]
MERKLGLLSASELSEQTQIELLDLERCIEELSLRANLQGYTEQVYTELLAIVMRADVHMRELKVGDLVTHEWIMTRETISREIESRTDGQTTISRGC